MTKIQKLELVLDGTPIISKESVKKIMFFSKKYKGTSFTTYKHKLKICPDIVAVCELFFQDKAFIEFIDILKCAAETLASMPLPSLYGSEMETVRKFLRLVEKLECFYELNKDTSHGIKDKRVYIFVDLKTEIIRAIRFLRKRSAPVAQKKYRKRISRRLFENLSEMDSQNR